MLPLTWGFGPRLPTSDGLRIFNIISPFILTKDAVAYIFGFDDPDVINEVSVHEFGHSFVNPLVDAPDNSEYASLFSYLFRAIEDGMREQGYTDWITCVKEHIVRVGEIRISYMLNDEFAPLGSNHRYVRFCYPGIQIYFCSGPRNCRQINVRVGVTSPHRVRYGVK